MIRRRPRQRRFDPKLGDEVWFSRPAYRVPRSLALIERGTVHAASSGAVVVQTDCANDGPVFHIVPRRSLHGPVRGHGDQELEREPQTAAPGQDQTNSTGKE